MKVWRIPSFGIDNLELAELPEPVPGPGEVLMRVKAVSLNHRDLMMVKGTYNPRLRLPRIPCSDGAGEVVAIGDAVRRINVGDRVAGIFMQNWINGELTAARAKGALGGDIDGMLGEYVVLPESGVLRFPEQLSFEEAATLPCAGVTAWNALTRASNTRAGDTVLIQGTGGVSLFALQFAKLLGARVLGTSGSDAKLDRARGMGLDEGVNYRTTPDWAQWALDQTGGRGVDLVVEVGGAGTLRQSFKAVKFGGTVAQVGILAGAAEALDLPAVLHKWIRIHGIYVGSRADFERMIRAFDRLPGPLPGGEALPFMPAHQPEEEDRLTRQATEPLPLAVTRLVPSPKLLIDQRFAFSDAPEAFRRMESGTHFGKLVIHMDS
ncbi:MAG TPA: NAD(P)-dependent alcohol dehydrogenase [Acidisarcina sp.]